MEAFNKKSVAVIAKNAEWSFLYARDVLHAPFPLGEAAISKHSQYYYHYKKLFPKKPRPAFFKY